MHGTRSFDRRRPDNDRPKRDLKPQGSRGRSASVGTRKTQKTGCDGGPPPYFLPRLPVFVICKSRWKWRRRTGCLATKTSSAVLRVGVPVQNEVTYSVTTTGTWGHGPGKKGSEETSIPGNCVKVRYFTFPFKKHPHEDPLENEELFSLPTLSSQENPGGSERKYDLTSAPPATTSSVGR